MVNGSGRGLEIRTRTGDSVHRAFCNLRRRRHQPDQGIQHGTGDGADGAQPILPRGGDLAPATPAQ